MSQTGDDGCLTVVLEEENVVQTFSEVGLILAVVLGFLVGCLIGVVIFKCFIGKSANRGAVRAVGNERNDESNKAVHASLTYENRDVTTVDRRQSFDLGEKRKDDQFEFDEFKGRKFLMLEDFVVDMTWDKMILELGKQELIQLLKVELSMWEERHVCLLQIYRCVLNDFLARKFIKEPQYHDVLNQEEKHLSGALNKMQEAWDAYMEKLREFKGQSVIDSFGPFQETYGDAVRNVVVAYRESSQRFLGTIVQFANKENADFIRENILTQMDEIEGFFRENQDEIIESIHLIFEEFSAVIRELVITLIAESELNRLLSVTCTTSLEKLVKTGRISSSTKDKMKDVLPDDFAVTKDEIKDVFSQFHPNIIAHYELALQKHESECDGILQSILGGYESQRSSDGFIQSYLAASCEQKLRHAGLFREFAESEHSGIVNKLAKISEIQEEKRLEAIRMFCTQLQENDALSPRELQQLKQEFVRKLDSTRGKVFSSCKRNISELWRLYHQHCGKQLEEDNLVDASILQDSVTDDLVSLEGFLQLQNNISDEDQHQIIQERESLFLLLVNQINTFRAKWIRVIENDLAKCQAFLLVKKSTDLVNDTITEVLKTIQRLWNERNSMRNYVKESATKVSMNLILFLSRSEMAKALSRKLTENLIAQNMPRKRDLLLLEEIQKNILEQISLKSDFSNFAAMAQDHNAKFTRIIQDELNRYNVALSMVEEDIRAWHTKRQGRLDVKSRRIAQHTPPSGVDMQPFLEQLLLQNQVSRATEAVESESIQQNLVETMRLDKSTIEEISHVSKDSKIFLVTKFAILVGVTKSEFTSCINQAKKSVGFQGNGRNITQRFSKMWKDALAYVEKISY